MISKTKLELQETAIKLFSEHGYDNVSVNSICKACNVSKTTFYFHFESKKDIIMDFYYKANIDSERYINDILKSSSSVCQLWNICEPYIQRSAEAGVSITRQVFKEFLYDKGASILPDNIYLHDSMIQLLTRAQESGDIANSSDIDTLFNTMISTFNGIALSWVMSDGSFDLLEESKKAFQCLLLPQKGADKFIS